MSWPEESPMLTAEREEARAARDVAAGARSRWELAQEQCEELNVDDWR